MLITLNCLMSTPIKLWQVWRCWVCSNIILRTLALSSVLKNFLAFAHLFWKEKGIFNYDVLWSIRGVHHVCPFQLYPIQPCSILFSNYLGKGVSSVTDHEIMVAWVIIWGWLNTFSLSMNNIHHFVISFLLLFLRNTKIPDGILNFNLPCPPICGKTSNSLNFKLILPYWPIFGVGLWILLANSNNQQVLSWLKCYSLTILSESLSICYWARHVVFGWYLMPLSFSFSYIWELLGSVWLLSPDIRDGDSGDKVDILLILTILKVQKFPLKLSKDFILCFYHRLFKQTCLCLLCIFPFYPRHWPNATFVTKYSEIK
jgi:hypothetical protein